MPIDLNADLGEDRGDDAALMPFITSANIACGGHAGNPATMRQTIQLALQHKVSIGAHPGYPDRATFGRTILPLTNHQIAETLLEQLDRLVTIAQSEGASVFHVKPHGALYNQAAQDAELAEVIAATIYRYNPALVLVGLAQSALTQAGAQHGLKVAHEGFVDRAYRSDGSLQPRPSAGAVIDDQAGASAQACSIASQQQVTAVDGSLVALRADTLCLHGDTPHALQVAQAVRRALAELQIAVLPLPDILP